MTLSEGTSAYARQARRLAICVLVLLILLGIGAATDFGPLRLVVLALAAGFFAMLAMRSWSQAKVGEHAQGMNFDADASFGVRRIETSEGRRVAALVVDDGQLLKAFRPSTFGDPQEFVEFKPLS